MLGRAKGTEEPALWAEHAFSAHPSIRVQAGQPKPAGQHQAGSADIQRPANLQPARCITCHVKSFAGFLNPLELDSAWMGGAKGAKKPAAPHMAQAVEPGQANDARVGRTEPLQGGCGMSSVHLERERCCWHLQTLGVHASDVRV